MGLFRRSKSAGADAAPASKKTSKVEPTKKVTAKSKTMNADNIGEAFQRPDGSIAFTAPGVAAPTSTDPLSDPLMRGR